MLFLMGGFNNYIDSMLEVASLSSFLPLEPFLDETCFFNWWVGVLLFGDKLEVNLSIDVIVCGLVM